ncbi:glucarate dehydratase [Bosea sp. BE271]|uniref:mandelate racemase/muconate lactonizing enzyme family protein n=1 Tax=Bosea TaxID=85413 RepID=UPI002863E473|nr:MULTISPECIES: mandelate racemase/muconate lactonizing enzyme family protein [Bosea]MDR6827660.1 glucarate dehydratase [Bosea robiniae]MDR6894646.1 glucarate dehydratase [Bosea sp. BE109]MDR7137766.1 glucarate dehydratase [Bosea sp. BE168]MDR7174465.1 glucarate dehydratase [Bosea sp. BE271]
MKITSISATPVTVPLVRPSAQSMGCGTTVTRTIVEIKTDSGLVGLGETGGADLAHVIERKFAPLLLGLDPRERTTARNLCLAKFFDYATARHGLELAAFAGVEIALWDLFAKSIGLPLYKALGGAVRERAPFSSYAFTVDLAQGYTEADVPGVMAALAARQVAEMGSSIFEFKVARYSVACDIATVKEIRRAIGPSVKIAVDANMRYSIDQAREFLRATADDLSNIEEPVPDLTDCSRLRRDFGVPLSTHCVDFDVLRGQPDIDNVVGAIDQQGGISRTFELATAANAMGKRYWLRSCLELGIAWAAMTHIGMAFKSLDRPAQGLIHWIGDDLIEGDVWSIRDDGVRAPDLPGLGVSLDRSAFEKAADYYRQDASNSLRRAA